MEEEIIQISSSARNSKDKFDEENIALSLYCV